MSVGYYLSASYRRKRVDADLASVTSALVGRVLDIGGARQRGRFRPPASARWIVADIECARRPHVGADVQDMPFKDAAFDAVKATEIETYPS